ncbi:hypothetical protein BD779DRAFT_1467989 [Infundibulicybe gibba]|nr:hypothetical protein BD779DRAFT_1467989 [Infundibulicybe gibba]
MPVPPRHAPSPLGDLERADDIREHIERLHEVELRLQDTDHDLRESENQREVEFRRNEEDRERIFLETQERRDREARQRADGVWQELDSRLTALPERPPPAHEGEEEEELETRPGVKVSVSSIRSAATEAASQHAADILETVKAEREEFAREREEAAAERDRLMAQMDAERTRMAEDRDTRIKALEDELTQVRAELENEKQQRLTEEAETRERERQELAERDDRIQEQLGDITNLIQNQDTACAAKKELMDSRWEEKQGRRQFKEEKWNDLIGMVHRIQEDLENDREKAEAEKALAASKPSLEDVINELRRQNAEQRELLENLSESWRSDCSRQHEETIAAVRETAHEQVPFNVQGYLNDFSKALSLEVRMLLDEVGKLREERRTLQHELGFLLCMKSKYGPGGEFDSEWKPPAPAGPPDDPPPEPPMPPEPSTARPGWRRVPQRSSRRKQREPPPPPPPQPDPRRQIASWATWQPDPGHRPTPPSVEPTLLVPDRGSPGLFGPRSPPGSTYRG